MTLAIAGAATGAKVRAMGPLGVLLAAMIVACTLALPGSAVAISPAGPGGSVAAPPGLSLHLPWASGETHGLGAWRYNGLNPTGQPIAASDHLCGAGAQDCYALDFVDLATTTAIHPVFAGTVVFAGCAYGGASGTWPNYGKVVYVETPFAGAVYGAFYAHLSNLLVETGDQVAPDAPIGFAGSTGRHLDGTVDCGANDPAGNIHLHFAIYRHDQPDIHPASWWQGGPFGGHAVVPEPLIGVSAYEDLATFTGSMAAAPDPVTGGPATPPVLGGQWMSPVGSATIGPRPTLVAWPSSTLEDVAITHVDFHATWPGGGASLCTATEGDETGLWRCEADLVAVNAPEGPIGLTFDVFDDAGDVTRAADGVLQVSFTMPPADPAAYLKAGIPESIRGTCRKRPEDRAIPGAIAAFNCQPGSTRIEEMAYYLMRPRDARLTFADRMDENGVRQGGDCEAGKAGIESEAKRLSSACYRDDQGRANLRFATSTTCPAVYWAVLGAKGDVARLTRAYADVVGGPWVDPGLGGRDQAPGCSDNTRDIGPPGAPRGLRLREIGTSSQDARAACRRADIPITREPGGCVVNELTWSAPIGEVDGYVLAKVGECGSTSKRYRDVVADLKASTDRVLSAEMNVGASECYGGYQVTAHNENGSASATVPGYTHRGMGGPRNRHIVVTVVGHPKRAQWQR